LVHLSAQPIFGSRVLRLPDPLNDIATVRLSSEEAERIGEMQVPPLSASAPFEHRNAVSAPYLVVGFRACEQQMDHRGKVWRHEITSLLVGAARQSYYSITRLPHERILLFDARPATFRSKHGAGGVPKLHGMSGSPVWRYNPSESHSIQNVPPLVGMLIGQPSASSKVMMAARIGLIFEHVAAAYPDLAGYLPRFR